MWDIEPITKAEESYSGSNIKDSWGYSCPSIENKELYLFY